MWYCLLAGKVVLSGQSQHQDIWEMEMIKRPALKLDLRLTRGNSGLLYYNFILLIHALTRSSVIPAFGSCSCVAFRPDHVFVRGWSSHILEILPCLCLTRLRCSFCSKLLALGERNRLRREHRVRAAGGESGAQRRGHQHPCTVSAEQTYELWTRPCSGLSMQRRCRKCFSTNYILWENGLFVLMFILMSWFWLQCNLVTIYVWMSHNWLLDHVNSVIYTH